MGKSFRKVVTIAGLVAIGFATFGVGAAIGIGGALGGTSLGVALGSSAILGLTNLQLLAVGLSLLSAGSTTDIESTGATNRSTPTANPDEVGKFVFGTTAVSLDIVYEEEHGNEPDRQVSDVFAHAWHRIESYQTMTISGKNGAEQISFTGEASVAAHTNVLWWFAADGTQTQSLQDTHTAVQMDNNAWPTDAIFEGVTHSCIVWNFDDENFAAHYNSIPTRVEIVVEGAWLYDPRLDPTYGTGSQDYGTPSSWSFNDGNAALVLLRFLIGEFDGSGNLIWGRGALEAQIDMDSFIAMANVSDETLDSIARFRLGGMHRLDGSFEGFVKRWETETGGKLYRSSGGVYYCWLPNDDLTALTTITEDDILRDVPIDHTDGESLENFFNMARGRYISAVEGYKAHPYPDAEEATEVAAEGQRILYHDFGWVQDESIAQRIARIKVRRSRYQRIWSVALGWQGQGPNFLPFTVHNLNCKETNDTDTLVRVIDRRRSFSGLTVLVLQEEAAAIYDDTIALGTAVPSDTIATRPDPFDDVPRQITNLVEDPWVKNATFGLAWQIDPIVGGSGAVGITTGDVDNALFLAAPDTTGEDHGIINRREIELENNDVVLLTIKMSYAGDDWVNQDEGTIQVRFGIRMYQEDGTYLSSSYVQFQNDANGLGALMPAASTWYTRQFAIRADDSPAEGQRMYARVYCMAQCPVETGTISGISLLLLDYYDAR